MLGAFARSPPQAPDEPDQREADHQGHTDVEGIREEVAEARGLAAQVIGVRGGQRREERKEGENCETRHDASERDARKKGAPA